MISIIIPCYNSEEYVKECIESVLAQKYTDFECLLIDDGSTDKTGEICKYYSSLDKRIKYYKKANQGVSATRNFGIEKASGNCCVFFDSDDILSESFLCQMVNHYNISTLPICGVSFVNKDNKYIKKFSQSVEDVEHIFKNFSYYRKIPESDILFNSIWNKIYNLNLIKEKGLLFDESISMAEDFLFNMQYLLNMKYVNLIEPVLYNHIENSTGICSQSDKKVLKYMYNEFYVLNKLRFLFQEKGISKKELSQYTREICIKYGVRILRFINKKEDVKTAVKFIGSSFNYFDILKEKKIKNIIFLFIIKNPLLFILIKRLRGKK